MVLLFLFRLGSVTMEPDPRTVRRRNEQYWGVATAPWARAAVLDRNGIPLALSAPAYGVFVDPVFWNDSPEARKMLTLLAPSRAREILAAIDSGKGRFIWVARGVEPSAAETAARIPGFYLLEESVRVYPLGSAASHLVGFCDLDGLGLAGIELARNGVLHRSGTTYRFMRGPDGRIIAAPGSETRAPAVPESPVRLSVDSRIQVMLHEELREGAVRHAAKWAAAVLMDVRTGEVLAMASFPEFDPLDRGALAGETIRNNAINRVYEPGSTFKILPMSSALDAGLVRLDEKLRCPGSIVVAGSTIRCTHTHRDQSPLEVVQNSCNVGMSITGLRFDPQDLYRTLRLWGLGEKTGIELPGEEPGLLQPPSSMRRTSLANIAIGQGVALTPLQMVRIVATIAAGGELVNPTILHSSCRDYVSRETAGAVVSQRVAKLMRDAMRMVVTSGTGKAANTAMVEVAGKTGTAQVPEGGKYASGRYVASFVGFWPYSEPHYAMAVIIGEPSKGGYYGGAVSAPVFRKIVERLYVTGMVD